MAMTILMGPMANNTINSSMSGHCLWDWVQVQIQIVIRNAYL